MTKMTNWVATRVALITLRVMSWLPLRLSQAVGRLIGLVNYRLNTRLARITNENIALCFPHMDSECQRALVRDSLQHTGQSLMETPAAWLGRFDRINAWIRTVEGEGILDEAIAEGKGVVVLLLHLGNWELFNVYFARRGKTTALYNPPRQYYLIDTMKNIRHRFGNELVPTNLKGITTLYRRLNEGHVITILPDQVPRRGVFAPFFGVAALTDQLVTRLLQKTKARVVCVYIRRLGDAGGFDVVFRKPVAEIYADDLMTSAAALNASVEACVREVPAQFQWEYKRFKERPAGERKLYRFNRPEGFH